MNRVRGAAMTFVEERTGLFYNCLERGRKRYPCQSLSCLLLCLLVLTSATGCFHKTPVIFENWQDTSPPKLSLKEKARAYQEQLESHHQMPDGLIRYRWWVEETRNTSESEYGNLADGCFHMGIYLASQALRYAATGDPETRKQVSPSLHAMKLYAEVSGVQGLLARYFSPVKPDDDSWLPSPKHPEYFWRSDVSRDQYAGYIHGLGVTLAVVSDPEIRQQVASLAAAIADHLIKNDLQIIDWDDKRTTYGDLRGRYLGFIPNGINALICLAIAKVAAESTGEQKYIDFYDTLVDKGYPRITRWTHFVTLSTHKRVNAHMAYLTLYPLLLLEEDQGIVRDFREGARRTWSRVNEDHNAFFSFIHAAVVGDGDEGKGEGRKAISEFPDSKVLWVTSKGEPRSTQPALLYLRPHSASLWVSDPYKLAGHLIGDVGFAGIDYLIAYWLGRYHGFIGVDE